MDFDSYQKEAHRTAVYRTIFVEIPDGMLNVPWVYPVMKLCGEAGEVSEKFGKVLRDDSGTITPEAKDAIVKEMGDVLWYLSEIATQINVKLDTIAVANVKKLQSRRERGVIQGSGDNR